MDAQVNEQQAEQVAETQTTQSNVEANFDKLADKVTVKFPFRKVPIEIDGKPTGEFTKRATVELDLPLLSVEGLIEQFKKGGKELELVMEAVRQVQIDRARELINDDEKITGADNFPFAELDWTKIANLPKAERRGGGISKEVWEEFSKDYVAVMPQVTGKTAEQIANAAKILLNKFQSCKTNKPVLGLLKDQLAIYAQNSSNAEQFSDCIAFLTEKADVFLNMDDAALLANL